MGVFIQGIAAVCFGMPAITIITRHNMQYK